MKKRNLLLILLLICTSILFAQQLELKTIASTSQFPDGILGNGVTLSDIKILDVLDNYLICKKPVPYKRQSDIFLLAKDLSSVKFLEIPGQSPELTPYHLCKVGNYYLSQVVKGNKQVSFALYDKNLNYIRMVSLGKYSNCAPVYLGKVGRNHFVKLMNGTKQFALASFDEQLNLIKVEPMERFGLVYCDSNYICLQNISLKAKFKDRNDGELLKMDKDMNIVLRKPITALWEQNNVKSIYKTVDTLGHTVFCNYGTYMAIDKETLEQTKLDLRSRGTGLIYTDTVIYESDRLIRIVLRFNSLFISVCDYNGNVLQNREMETNHHSQQESAFLEYRNNKVYVLLNKKKDIVIVSLDIETGAQDTISSFQLEQNPGYTPTICLENTDCTYYDVSADIWKYDDNSYNLVVTTEKDERIAFPIYQPRSNTYVTEYKHFYEGYLSYIHLDKNFQLLKMEEGTYPNVRTINRCSYKPIHHFGNYTLLLQYIPDKEMTSDVQFVIWDKSGNRKVVPTNLKALFAPGGKYSTYTRGWPLYPPVIYKCSPNRYYILAGIYNLSKNPTPLSLTELTIKP